MRRISDEALSSGLEGAFLYVLTRSMGNLLRTPFDKIYLEDLYEVAKKRKIERGDSHMPIFRCKYMDWFGGKVVYCAPLLLSGVIGLPNIPQDKDLWKQGVGISSECAGVELRVIVELVNQCIMKYFYLVVDRVDTENCSIGTYVGQMLQCLKGEIELSVIIVELDSSESELKEIEVDGLKYLRIPLRYKGLYRDSGMYYRTVAYLLCTMMDDDKINIFHFNYLHRYDITYKMKELCPKAIVWVTVHFINWVLALKGNVDKLHSLLGKHILKGSLILRDYIGNDNMLRPADKVIFLSAQTQKTLCDEYRLDMCKSVAIASGIADYDIKISKSVGNKIRNSFGFLQNDKIILYSDHLEEGKGVDGLTGAFLILLKKMPAYRLVIAGSGDFNRCFHLVRFCSRITFVGELDQKRLYKAHQIADIGVLLSFTE